VTGSRERCRRERRDFVKPPSGVEYHHDQDPQGQEEKRPFEEALAQGDFFLGGGGVGRRRVRSVHGDGSVERGGTGVDK
jgi:hypothetical protein